MTKLNIRFSRYSAFYSPLIAAKAAGFLRREGLDAEFRVATDPAAPRRGLENGSLQVIQSAVSSSWGPLEKGQTSPVVHFAQINARDGFFLAGRRADPDFTWAKLAGRTVLVDHGGQPLAMFKYACHKMGLDYRSVKAVDAGDPDAMERAFRDGHGDYVHLQGPAPQQLEADGVGHVVAAVGDAIGPVAFSSLAACRDWLHADEAQAFMRAFSAGKNYVGETPAAEIAAEIAAAGADYFPAIDRQVLTRTIERYQQLGCWTAGVEIDPTEYQTALDVFQHSGLISRRHDHAAVVVPPPR